MLAYLIVFVIILIAIDRLKNQWYIFRVLNIISFWLYVLVHEIWHWISAFIFWRWIHSIKMSFTPWQIDRTWFLWLCTYYIGWWRISRAIVAYSWELFTILIWFLWWYLYWIWKIEYLFYVFSAFFIIYAIYWETFIDKVVWKFLVMFFLCFDNKWIRENDFWIFDFLDTWNLPLVKEIICFVILWLIIWWTITNIFKLNWHVWMIWNEVMMRNWNKTLSSDASQIQHELWIPQIVTYWSWITLLWFVLCMNYSMMFWKQTWVDYIDEKVKKVEQFIKFKRNVKVIEKYENKDLIKELNKQ